MTNEAEKVELTNEDGFPRRFTAASSATFSKGQLLQFDDARTAAAATVPYDAVAGIASMEKEADFSTSVTVWTDGIFEMAASGSIDAGAGVCSASDANYPNQVATIIGLTNPASGAGVLGYALETATDQEVINVRVRV